MIKSENSDAIQTKNLLKLAKNVLFLIFTFHLFPGLFAFNQLVVVSTKSTDLVFKVGDKVF